SNCGSGGACAGAALICTGGSTAGFAPSSTALIRCAVPGMMNNPAGQFWMIAPLTAKVTALVADQTRLYVPTRRDIVCASASQQTRLSSAGQTIAAKSMYRINVAAIHP